MRTPKQHPKPPLPILTPTRRITLEAHYVKKLDAIRAQYNQIYENGGPLQNADDPQIIWMALSTLQHENERRLAP